MDERGKTVAVTKQCATTETCSSQVGCRQNKETNQTVKNTLSSIFFFRLCFFMSNQILIDFTTI